MRLQVAAALDERPELIELPVDGLRAGDEGHLIDASEQEHPVAVFVPELPGVRVQGLDGEHAVDAAPEPARNEVVDPAVAVEDVDGDPFGRESVRDPQITGHHELLE